MIKNAPRVAVVMDPIGQIKTYKDTTFAMMLEAQRRGWPLYYLEQNDLSMRDSIVHARWKTIHIKDDTSDWYEFLESGESPLGEIVDVVLMRKDPPFDMDYIYTTYLLEQAQAQGVTTFNSPRGLREVNEKLSVSLFPQCCAPTLVSSSRDELKAFVAEQEDVIVKPLDMMGGASIFRVNSSDYNLNVILENMTHFDRRMIMAQRFIPEITAGDKRVLLINGEPVPYALARIPQKGETRGNLAAGGRGEGIAITERDRWICEQIAPRMKELGLLFVGIDIIGDYLTEINVTSPTCVRELDSLYGLNISAQLFDVIEQCL